METTNKKRGANYTYTEKQMFQKLVNEYKHIIENKATTSECVQAKQNAWETITKKYNDISSSTGPRNSKQLRHLYENLKQRIRKDTSEKNEIMKNQPILHTGEHRHTIEIKPLVTPPYDDAATFFENTSNDEDTMDEEKFEIQPDIDLDMLDIDQGHSSWSGNPKPKGIVHKYYSMKIKNAALERKYLMQRKKCLEIQHKYKVMIANLKLQLIRKKLNETNSISNECL